jgi:hypothetical protein
LPQGALISIPDTGDYADGVPGGVTASALLEKLPEATILHLACHGHQDPENPLNSGFVMSDEMLTIERLMQVPLPGAFMAFLSACETAKGDQASAEINAVNDSTLIMVFTPESTRSGGPSGSNHALRRIQEYNRHTLVNINFLYLSHVAAVSSAECILNRSMEDVDGPIIAKLVYEDVLKGDSAYLDPDDVAYALDAAVRHLRREVKDPRRWAPYIHLGI